MPLDLSYLTANDDTAEAALMHVSNSRSPGATTIDVDTVSGVPAKFIATYGVLNAQGFINPATAVNFYGHLSGSDLEIDGILPGSTDAGNDTGDVVVIRPSGFGMNLISEALNNVMLADGSGLSVIPGSALENAYPVGSIYMNASVSTNPNTLLGFGTWAAFGSGRVPVSIDAGQSEFNVLEETGGSKTHTLTSAEMPSHTHIQNAHTHTSPGGVVGGVGGFTKADTAASSAVTVANATATNQNTGGGDAHNNLQPYIVVAMWKRTA